MKTVVNLKPTLAFLKDLEQNNSKAWFDANRTRYDEAREAFETFVQAMIVEINKFDLIGDVEPKDCIFRIHREQRCQRSLAHVRLPLYRSTSCASTVSILLRFCTSQ